LERRMNKHHSAKELDRAFKGLVRLRRRLGFPAWSTFPECDKGMQGRAPEYGTWREYLESRASGSANTVRNFIYIINEHWGTVPWENAHLVPSNPHDKHGDPVVDDKSTYDPICMHGRPLKGKCHQCDDEAVGDGMPIEGQAPKKRLLRKKKLRKKGGA